MQTNNAARRHSVAKFISPRSMGVYMGLAVVLLFGLATWNHAQTKSAVLAFKNVRVFDGQRTIENATVVVEDGKIRAVGKGVSLPAHAEVIDGTGKTLLPGLIDSHTHAYGNALKEALVFGVTTEMDMFTDIHYLAQMKAEEKVNGALDQADIFSAGTLTTAPGGHGTEYGIKIPTIASPDEAQAFVDARIAEGSDYIKIIYDDGATYGLHFPTLSKATMAAVIAAAHKRGKMAVVHIGSLQEARDAIACGANGLAHLFVDRPPDPQFGAFVAAHHAFVVATLTVLQSIAGAGNGASLAADPNFKKYLSDSDVANLKRNFPIRPGAHLDYPAAEEAVRQLKAAHVPILAGTDSPNPGTTHGASLHQEMELLVKAGLTPTEALAAATSVPAKIFHLKDRGRIAPGLRADLLLVEGNPTKNITDTRNIVGVWKLGVEDNRQAYADALQKQRTEAAQLQSLPAPAGLASGEVSDFEGNKLSARFGFGWVVSTDTIAGGKSTAQIKLTSGGAEGSKGSLSVTGEIAPGFPYAWAGAMFCPGTAPMAPANLSSKKALSFWAKGDNQVYRVMLFSKSQGYMPISKNFTAGPEWKQYTFPLSAFNGIDGHDLMALLFVGGPNLGPFSFQIDDVRFQ